MHPAEIEILAREIHELMCNDTPACVRWRKHDSPHHRYYYDRAESIIDQLEPVIGIANVYVAVRCILDELP